MVDITNYLPIGPNHPVSSKSEGRIMVDITNPPPSTWPSHSITSKSKGRMMIDIIDYLPT